MTKSLALYAALTLSTGCITPGGFYAGGQFHSEDNGFSATPFAAADSPASGGGTAPECRMGSDGSNTCGYNCRMGSNGHFYCSSVPDGSCAFNSNGTWSCP